MKASVSRRDLLTGLAALGASAFLPSGSVWAQAPAGRPRRLDLHHHFATPRWIKKLRDSQLQGWQQFQDYTPAKAIEAMDRSGVATAFVSITTPGVFFGGDFEKERQDARGLARELNEYGARMASDHKGRFGLFAVLPLPEIDASLRSTGAMRSSTRIQPMDPAAIT